MVSFDPLLAYSRFGLGTRATDLANAAHDARGALVAEITDPKALLLEGEGLLDTVAALGQIRQFQQARQQARRAGAASDNPSKNGNGKARPAAMMATGAMGSPGAMEQEASTAAAAIVGPRGKIVVPGVMSAQQLMLAEIAARAARVKQVPIGFAERLVAFWANHFAVQAAANEMVRGLAGAFEREAIRPHVLGRFADMLMAATRHPAMLVSLNNYTSIGPDSPIGKRTGKGLNENHARELMELHSIGVDGGYTQADVTSFAKVLTGWTFGANLKQPRTFGRFVFRANAHEPGPQTVCGKVYSQRGVKQGEAVIADLARSPATARHIALKLARHFVADEPDPALVTLLANTFISTDGDLRAVSQALVEAPGAWSAPPGKIKTPQQFLWASLRALDLDPKPNFVVRVLNDLGQPLWNPPSPQGFKDDVATWLAPDAMTVRLDTAELMAAQARSIDDPRQLADDLMGPGLSSDTRSAVARAESRTQAIALLLMSPEFQRS